MVDRYDKDLITTLFIATCFLGLAISIVGTRYLYIGYREYFKLLKAMPRIQDKIHYTAQEKEYRDL